MNANGDSRTAGLSMWRCPLCGIVRAATGPGWCRHRDPTRTIAASRLERLADDNGWMTLDVAVIITEQQEGRVR